MSTSTFYYSTKIDKHFALKMISLWLLIAIIFQASLFYILVNKKISQHDRYLLKKSLQVECLKKFRLIKKTSYIMNGKELKINVNELSDYLKENEWDTITSSKQKIKRFFFYSFSIYGVLFILLGILFYRWKKFKRQHHIKGALEVPTKELNRKIKNEKLKVYLRIGEIWFPIEYEIQSVFVIGCPGSGKTVLLLTIIYRVIERGDRAIVYEVKGDFLPYFYNKQKDKLFSPLSNTKNSIRWTIFNDLVSELDIDAFTAAMIPEPQRTDKPYFNLAARQILAGIIRYCIQTNQKSNKAIFSILQSDNQQLKKILPGNLHDHLNNGDVMSTLHLYTYDSFRILADLDGDFSINKWVHNEKSGNLFITNSIKESSALKPLFSVFFELLSRELMSLSQDLKRRIFLFLDEFGTLHKLQNTIKLMTLCRAMGVSLFISIQDLGQLNEIYGHYSAQTIINACSTHIVFRLNDPDTQEYFARKFGQSRTSVLDEGTSIDLKGGGSKSFRMKEIDRPLIMPTELDKLPNLSCYVSILGFPVTKTKLKYKKFEIKNPNFIDDDKMFHAKNNGSIPTENSARFQKNTIDRKKNSNKEELPSISQIIAKKIRNNGD